MSLNIQASLSGGYDMAAKQAKGSLKHYDFIIADLICMQVCFLIAFWITNGFHNPYVAPNFSYQISTITFSQLMTIVFSSNYSGILRRRRFEEAWAVGKYIIWVVIITLITMFIFHNTQNASRLLIALTMVLFWVFDYLTRQSVKRYLLQKNKSNDGKRSIVLMTDRKHMKSALDRLHRGVYQDFFVPFAVVIGNDTKTPMGDIDIPVYRLTPKTMEKIRHDWVDEVFILQPDTMLYPTEIIKKLNDMGLSVSYTVAALEEEDSPVTSLSNLGAFKVITTNAYFMTPGAAAAKRVMDIVGSIIGCILTGIIFIFVAPFIYHADPGPIFFKQKRVGQNGKIFEMYKFRSMYQDAEERKASLMAKNKMSDGMMFKVDDDPRIIGSEHKDKNGKPCGIGNFLRKEA